MNNIRQLQKKTAEIIKIEKKLTQKLDKANNMKKQDELLRILLPPLSPVIMRTKPSVLLKICKHPKWLSCNACRLFSKHRDFISHATGLEHLVMRGSKTGVQVLFYDVKILNKALEHSRALNILRNNGYRNLNLDAKLDKLSSIYRKGDMPHEIGLFLGYPAKDVEGFINRRGQGIMVSKGRWKIFGDIDDSLKVMSLHRAAENFCRNALAKQNDVINCIGLMQNLKIDDLLMVAGT